MDRISRFCLAMLVLALAGGAAAAEQSVYFNLGLGWASASYPDETEEMLDMLEEMPGVDHLQIGIDLGLYFRIQPGSVLGVAVSGIGDRYDDGSDHLQLNQYLYAASFRHYPSGETGHGLFVRGDVGMSKLVLDVSGLGSESSDSGFGFLVGGGYSFPIGSGTWFSINADYTSKSIEDETVGGYTIGGAFLF